MKFFKEICAIPHGSYNIDRISDYLADFAKARGLEYIQDDLKNVIIFKAATPGYENEPAIMLQGHMDMVAVCDNPSEKDMEKDGLEQGEIGKVNWVKELKAELASGKKKDDEE